LGLSWLSGWPGGLADWLALPTPEKEKNKTNSFHQNGVTG